MIIHSFNHCDHMVHFYKTYIKGYDPELGGGIPQGHIILVAGTPGTMKSSLSYYFLYHNVRKTDARGLYLSFEQSKDSLEFQLKRMNMAAELGDRLQIVDLTRIRHAAGDYKSKNWLNVVQKHLELLHEKYKFTLLVIDSLPVLEILSLIDEKRTKLFQFFEWLRELYFQDELKTDFRSMERPLSGPLPYHAPCQYRAHRMGKPALEIMELIPGLDLRESLARCCGIGGTYGYKVEKYQIAMDVGQELFDFVREQGSGVELTACDSETCRWQLEHGTGIPSRHPIEILAAAYGLYDLVSRNLIDD